jgi:hypothetical protein
MTSKSKPRDTDRIDAIIAVLAANGMSLPDTLGGDPAPAPEPEAAPADAS